MPAAAVIPAPVAYIKSVAVETSVVEIFKHQMSFKSDESWSKQFF